MRRSIWIVIALLAFNLVLVPPAVCQEELQEQLKRTITQMDSITVEMEKASEERNHDLYNQLEAKWKELEQKTKEISAEIQKAKSQSETAIFAKKSFNDGISQYRTGNYSEAIKLFEKSLELETDNAAAHYMIGICHQVQQELIKAKQAYLKTIEVDPTYVSAYVPLANILSSEGNPREALKYYGKAVELDPEQYKAFYGIGNVHFRAEKYSEAEKAYRDAVNVDPTYGDGWIGLGRALQGQGKHQDAIKALKSGLKHSKKSYLGYYVLAEAYNQVAQYQQALDAANSALKIKRNYAPAQHEKGVALMNLGRKNEAIAAFEEAKKDRAWQQRSEHYIKKIKGLIQ